MLNFSKTIVGISSGYHDASIAVINNNKIVYASSAERFSKIKNDSELNIDLILDSLNYYNNIDEIIFYENPILKKIRQIYSGQIYNVLTEKNQIKKFKHLTNTIDKKICSTAKTFYINHHLSHAGIAEISPFNKAIVLVVDAIGEFDTISIWLYDAKNKFKNRYKKLKSYKYPKSLGLLYSAITKYIGLKPNEEEYIMMGMAAYGNDNKYLFGELLNLVGGNSYRFNPKINVHKGLPKKIIEKLDEYTKEDIAKETQNITEQILTGIFIYEIKKYLTKYNITNVVYTGGVALNSVANNKLYEYFNKDINLWIYCNPGDSGSALGAALIKLGKKTVNTGPYLGYNINRQYPVQSALKALLAGKIIGIANGRAEFGPRALGNRSILANPQCKDIKDKVNDIKLRDKFRPFAPAILPEVFDRKYKNNITDYMQLAVNMTDDFSLKYPAVVHIDNSARIQTVDYSTNPGFYELLKQFYNKTGCPALLNTSLNIKGQPILNDEQDIINFENLYNVNIHV